MVLLSLCRQKHYCYIVLYMSINLPVFMPILAVIPRQLFSVIGNCYLGGIFSRVWIDHDVRRFNWIIAISIVSAYRFYDATNLLGLVGYHRYHYISTSTTTKKKRSPTISHIVPRRLPSEIAAVAAGIVLSFVVVIPYMSQVLHSLQAELLVYDRRYRA